MKIIKKVLLLLTSIGIGIFILMLANSNDQVVYRSLSELRVNGEQGISAPFAGRCDDFFIVAGGCNFPDVPAAVGGKKVFYDTIFAYSASSGEKEGWKMIGNLPKALAYGASVTVPEGVVLIGGTDGKQSSDAVCLLQYDGKSVVFTSLPNLPLGLDNFGAAFGDGYIYVAGGSSNGEGVLRAYRLPYPNGTSWEPLPNLAGSERLQPTCVMQTGVTGLCFYVMGGYTSPTKTAPGRVHTDGVYFNTETQRWHCTSSISVKGERRALVGAAGVPFGSSELVFLGGVNYDIFQKAINRPIHRRWAEHKGDKLEVSRIDAEAASYMQHPEAWYKFNDDLLIYNTITDTWIAKSRSPLLARAGAVVVPYDKEWIFIDGESKPGIRSADVTAIRMPFDDVCTKMTWGILLILFFVLIVLYIYFK